MIYNRQIFNFFLMVIGTFSLSLGAVGFLAPNETITGGGVGIALLLHHLFPAITLGIFVFTVSVPFVILAFIFFGKEYTFKTFIVIILLSTFTDLLKEVFNIPPLTDDILLGSIFGGLLVGIGVGLMIRARTSTGSTSVIGEIVARKTKYKAGEVLLSIDGVIMFASIFVFGDLEKSLYSLLSVFVTSRIIDAIITGRQSKKMVNIVSDRAEHLSEVIRDNIEEHGTLIKGVGLHQGIEKTIILLTVDASKIQLLKDLINHHDSEAFLIIFEASEYMGRGHNSA